MAAVDPLGGRGVADLRDIIQLVEEDLARVEEIFEAQFRSDVGLVGEIGRYIREGGGKRIRPALLLLACRLCGYRGERAITLASVVGFASALWLCVRPVERGRLFAFHMGIGETAVAIMVPAALLLSLPVAGGVIAIRPAVSR